MVSISVIVPTYNRKKLLGLCLNSLFNQDYPKNKYEIIVVDDASNDGTEQYVKVLLEKHKNLRYFKYKINRGPGASRNTGAKYARYKTLAFIDDDCVPCKNWIKNIVITYKKHPNESVIQGKVKNKPENISGIISDAFFRVCINKSSKKIKNPKKWYVNVLGCNFSIKKSILSKTGLFDEKLRINEDIDLKCRLLKNKKRILYNPNIKVIHKHRPNICSYYKRSFYYGRHHYYFKNKGGGKYSIHKKENIKSSDIFKFLYSRYQLKGVFIFLLSRISNKISNIGYLYEKYLKN